MCRHGWLGLACWVAVAGCARGTAEVETGIAPVRPTPADPGQTLDSGPPPAAVDSGAPNQDAGTTPPAAEDAAPPPGPSICTGGCDDGDPCTIDLCREGTCEHSAASDGTACESDANPCTADVCSAGVCDHQAQTGNPCTDDLDPCTDDLCSAGICAHQARTSGSCDDGQPCTSNDQCTASGTCEGTPDDSLCDDGNPCTDNVCSAASGCEYPSNSGPCDDGVSCTDSDVCSDGVCTGEDTCGSGGECSPSLNACRSRLSVVAINTVSFGAVGRNFDGHDVGEMVFFDDLSPEQDNLVLANDAVNSGGDLNAVARSGDDLLLAIDSPGSIAGTSVGAADLVRYSPADASAVVVFDANTVLDCDGDCDDTELSAVHELPDGGLLLSFDDDVTVIGSGVLYDQGTILRYSPTTGAVTEEVPAALWGASFEVVNGLTVHPVTGNFLITFNSSSPQFGDGPEVDNADVVELSFGPGESAVASYTVFLSAATDLDTGGSNMIGLDVQ